MEVLLLRERSTFFHFVHVHGQVSIAFEKISDNTKMYLLHKK